MKESKENCDETRERANLELIVHYPPGWKETDKRKIKFTGSVLSHSGNPRLLAVVEDGKETKVDRESPYWTDIRVLDAGEKSPAGLPGKDRYFEITLPKALMEGQPKSLELGWIDFYRG